MRKLAIILSLGLSVILSGCGAFMFFMTLVALNGFNGRSGEWAIFAFFFWAVAVTIFFPALAMILGLRFGRPESVRKVPFWISMAGCFILGIIGEFAGIFVAVIVAEAFHNK